MMLLDRWRANRDRVARAGETAIELAHAAGVPACYRDRDLGPGIVKAMPDGELVLVDEAQEVERLDCIRRRSNTASRSIKGDPAASGK